MKYRIPFAISILFWATFFAQSVWARDTNHLYSTWKGLEPDKCASAWLIARFIDSQAVFKMIDRGQTISQGTGFDTPQARFRVSHRGSTFDSMCEHYNIEDPAVLRIRRIIRDIELNTWEENLTSEASGLQALINGLRIKNSESVQALKKSFVLFDWLYAHFASKKP